MNLQRLQPYVSQSHEAIKDDINAVFDTTIKRARNNTINPATFAKHINERIKQSKITLEPTIEDNPATPGNCPMVGGFCFMERKGQTPRIEILFYPSGSTRLAMDEEHWELFRYKIHETILHELVHRGQFLMGHHKPLQFRPNTAAKFDPELLKEQQYMGDISEIEAYAHDCAEYWFYAKPGIPLTLRHLKSEFVYETNIHSIQYYYDTYHGDKKHPAVARFFSKVIEWGKLITPLANSLPPCPVSRRNGRRLIGLN